MVKKVVCFSLGGHIAPQNVSFRRLEERLSPHGYVLYGAEDAFKAFETGNVYELNNGVIPKRFAGFYAGAGRASLTKKDGSIDERKLEQAVNFFKKGEFDVAIGSGGDDHGKQMDILRKELEGKVRVYVINKTMDNDLGGKDGEDGAPYTDFTSGFHTAVNVGVQKIHEQFSGAWTNNVAYLIGHFGRETNWVGAALAYWGLADKIIYGELPENHLGHSIEKINELILEAQDKNEKQYGRRFAMIVVPEGTRISGVQHIAPGLIDAHGHHKLQPEVLVANLKTELKKRFNTDVQTVGITYEMRNSPPTPMEMVLAECSADAIADAIIKGDENGLESVFKIEDEASFTRTAPIAKVSQKRYAGYYPKQLINPKTFEVTDEIGKYYEHLFGRRKDLSKILPSKPRVVNVFK